MIILGPVAIAANGVIGKSNDLPWYLPEDLKRFKEVTSGHTVVMGRKTYESIIARIGKPLPNRKNIVVSGAANYHAADGVSIYPSLDAALNACRKDEKIFLIGGARIFQEGIDVAELLYVTHLHKDYDGDVYFPTVNWGAWEKISEEPHEDFTFALYKKRSRGGENNGK